MNYADKMERENRLKTNLADWCSGTGKSFLTGAGAMNMWGCGWQRCCGGG